MCCHALQLCISRSYSSTSKFDPHRDTSSLPSISHTGLVSAVVCPGSSQGVVMFRSLLNHALWMNSMSTPVITTYARISDVLLIVSAFILKISFFRSFFVYVGCVLFPFTKVSVLRELYGPCKTYTSPRIPSVTLCFCFLLL